MSGGDPRDGHELVVSRAIAAPPALVFELWTKPEHLVAWWGPDGYSLPTCQLDFRVGGAFRFHMVGPSQYERWIRGVFREITPPARLVLTFAWADAEKVTGPETIVTVTFEPEAGGTRVTVRQAQLVSGAAVTEHRHGWQGSLLRLARYAAGRAVPSFAP
jgi:uncharacterized protein YndB with AHSA1/START domain